MGIGTFGPLHSEPHFSKPVRLGVIGTGNGVQLLQAYLDRSLEPVRPGLNRKDKHYDALCFPDFPGAKPQTGFRAHFSIERTRDIPLPRFEHAVKGGDVGGMLRAVVELVVKQIEMMRAMEPCPDVVLVVLPSCVESACRTVGSYFQKHRVPLSGVEKAQRSLAKEAANSLQGVLGLEFTEDESPERDGFWNLHDALKAHAMRFSLPTQIAWESTLAGHGLTQDPATTAWNFFTALYYKANNIPWQLEVLAENTCYVGLSFFRSDPRKNALQSSLAQAFSGHGEGLVLQGPKSISDRKGNPTPHLGETEAEKLLRDVLKLYTDFHEVPPRRVVIHKSSCYWEGELKGFRRALESIPRHDLVAIDRRGHRIFRTGEAPPVRGTVVSLSKNHHVLYTTGYIPALRAYPGMRVPLPLEIVEHHGDSSAEVICREILALTKLNWNSCNFACTEPITLQFAKTVGRILRELPQGVTPERLYRFYM